MNLNNLFNPIEDLKKKLRYTIEDPFSYGEKGFITIKKSSAEFYYQGILKLEEENKKLKEAMRNINEIAGRNL